MESSSRALSGGAAVAIALVLVVVAIGALLTVDLTRAERVPENVSVDGVELGGGTEEEAAAIRPVSGC